MPENMLDNEGFNGLVKARYGYMLYNKHDTYIGKAIEKYGEFSELEAVIFKQICTEGDIVLDVGANIGAHTLAMSHFVGQTGRVHAFEPQPVIFQTLCANVALNSFTNVSCYNMALSDKEGQVLIPNIDYSKPGNYGGINVQQFEQGHRVPEIRIDKLLNVNRLKLIKIDVEGMEHEVISGAKETIKKHQPVIYMENDRTDKSKDLIELMWSLDYKMFWHMPKLFNPNNYAKDDESMHPNIVSVNMICFPKSASTNLTGFLEITDSSWHPFANKK